MADIEKKEVKQPEPVTPPEEKEEEGTGEENETPPESSQDENEGGEGEESDPEEAPEKPVPVQKTPPTKEADKTASDDGLLKEVPGETPREKALRLEVTKLKRAGKQDRVQDLAPKGTSPAPAKQELSPEKKKILERYKPEELQAFKEVFDVIGEDMGFVRKNELGATTYTDKANAELETFLDKHPEYLPENDPDSLLWGRFKSEYELYKQPANPKDFARIFNKVHQEIFDIKPAGELKTVNAAREKVKVASHAGASTPRSPTGRPKAATPGIRTDMLKGFSEEEIAEMEG